uniref:Uncharacterized protein n=1 Tax=Rhizophora mucronata TaxID=61149 RepID=A0A2P2QZC8_RHIMU
MSQMTSSKFKWTAANATKCLPCLPLFYDIQLK